MCGICGFTGNKDDSVLRRMTDVIRHRGPDDDGYFADGRINLGMRRLSIVDLMTGRQPVYNEDKTVWAVFNGEIYNFTELRRDLEARGHSFYTDHSDTECIVHLYEEFGRDFVLHINGMFAIALWDQRSEQLLLVRDRMGVKPLFYTDQAQPFIFGSEIKSILAHPRYHKEPDYEALYHYFTFKCVPAPLTAFKGIRALRPGEMLVYADGRYSTHKWWKVRYQEDVQMDEQQAQAMIIELLEDAVRLRMQCDVPFGAYLSGGVDSSTIVAIMTRYSGRPVKTFSLGYEDELKNKEADLFYARKVSKAYSTEHYEYIMSYKELVDDIESVIRSFDQPFSGTISTYFLSKLISRHVKVALSGDGADELFGSYLSHRIAQPMRYFSQHYSTERDASRMELDGVQIAPFTVEQMKEWFDRTGGDEMSLRYHLCLFSDEEKQGLLTPEFKRRAAGASSWQLLRSSFEGLTARSPLNRVLEMEWNTQLPDQMLAFADALSMAHSVEVRSPFLDYRLVEYVATIPGHLKIRDGNVKDILKRAVAPLLPEGITARPKEGFVLPIFDWMVDKLRSYSGELLSSDRLRRHGLVNEDASKALYQRYYDGDRSVAGRIWNLIMFQVWWENYFD